MKIKKFIPIYFKAIKNKNTPVMAKLMGIFAIAYAILPADIIPDVVPFLGILDDAIVLPFLIYLASKMIPDEVMDKEKPAIIEE